MLTIKTTPQLTSIEQVGTTIATANKMTMNLFPNSQDSP